MYILMYIKMSTCYLIHYYFFAIVSLFPIDAEV